MLSNRVDGRVLNKSTEEAFCPSISQYIDLLTVFKIFILFLLLVSSLSWNEFCLFWIQRFLFELLNDLPVEQKYSASNTEVFPEPLEPKKKLFKSENSKSRFTHKYSANEIIEIPVAHNEGNYFADQKTINNIEDKDLVAFRYCNKDGIVNDETNPNGSKNNIAGIINEQGNILGMMPHPERASDKVAGLIDGEKFFISVLESIQWSK